MNLKRIVFIFVLLLTLSSCGAVTVGNVRPNSILNGTFSAQYMQAEYIMNVTADESGKLICNIQSPDVLKNVSVICSADEMIVKCGDVQTECSDGYYPMSELYNVIASVNNSEPVVRTKNQDTYIFKYRNGEAEYSVVTDNVGTVREIKTPLCNYFKR